LSQTKKVDLILRNARIIDGTGEPSQYGDVAIQDDRPGRALRLQDLAPFRFDAHPENVSSI